MIGMISAVRSWKVTPLNIVCVDNTAVGITAVSIPIADITGSATVSEHLPTQEISCIVTAFYCFLGGEDRDSKRTGVVHVAFNTIGTVIFMIIMTLLQQFNVFGNAFWSMTVDSTVIAIFQSLFNIFTAILLLMM